MGNECTVGTCTSKVLAKGKCSFHYHKAVRERNKLRTCSINNCSDPVSQVGMCFSHYHRRITYGDPLAGGTRKDERTNWLIQTVEQLVANPTNECVLTTYGVDSGGYPGARLDGKPYRMHQAVLALTGRPTATKGQLTRHLCGNKRCVNPRHIEVGTYSANFTDAVEHGTASVGSRHNRSKLTEKDVIGIRTSSKRQVDLAAEYGVSQSHISHIKSGHVWKHVPQHHEPPVNSPAPPAAPAGIPPT